MAEIKKITDDQRDYLIDAYKKARPLPVETVGLPYGIPMLVEPNFRKRILK